MAGLNSLDPQGELLRRIVELEAAVRRIGTTRRNPVPVCQIVGGSGVALGAGSNIIGLNSVSFASEGWADALPAVTFPVGGIYLVLITVPFMTGASIGAVVTFGGGSVQVATSESGQQTVGFARAFTAGQTASLGCALGAGRTPGTDWSVNIARLADTPEL